jgi:integrase
MRQPPCKRVVRGSSPLAGSGLTSGNPSASDHEGIAWHGSWHGWALDLSWWRGGSGGNPHGRVRPRGNIEALASGALRVRVYAGVDVLTGRELYLKQTVPAGRDAQRRAEQVRDQLIQQVEQGRQPRTNASLRALLERHLEVAQVEPRGRLTLQGYVRKHVGPLIGDTPIGSVNAELLDSFYAELRRCRDHCDGQSAVLHRVVGDHECDRRCRPHVCKPLAAWTVRHIHYLLSAAYENAIRWDWISVNPMSRARKPAPPRPDPQPPTAAESGQHRSASHTPFGAPAAPVTRPPTR